MESLKHYLNNLTTLQSLANRVEAFASLCLPDFVYTSNADHGLSYVEVDLAAVLDDHAHKAAVGISMGEDAPALHLFTKWSRSQLLSRLGVREKFFSLVSYAQQASELNMRVHALHGFMIRTMKSYETEDLRIVRGVVSSQYNDIPDTDIMKALLEIMPDGFALRSYSGKTDRAFYAYAVTGDEIRIPGTQFRGFPGVVVKNSEVGYTSLWMIPMLWLADSAVPLILEKDTLLRRVHRGTMNDLVGEFNQALEKGAGFWGSLAQRLAKLQSITFSSEDEAVERMTSMLVLSKASKMFIWRCEQAYRAAGHLGHNGAAVFETVLDRVKAENNQDDAYISAALAGAVLMQLIR